MLKVVCQCSCLPQQAPRILCSALPRQGHAGHVATPEPGGWASAPSPQQLAQQHLIRLRGYLLGQYPLQNFPEG